MSQSFDESEEEEIGGDFRTHLRPVERVMALLWMVVIALGLLPWFAGFGLAWAVIGCVLAAFAYLPLSNFVATFFRRSAG